MANLNYFNPVTGQWEEIKVSTRLKDLYNTVKLTQDQNYVNIGVTSFNPNEDVIFVIWNSTWLQKDEDFIVNGGLLRIESKDGSNWKNGDTFNFIVLKNIDKDTLPSADGSLIQDGSITIAKLATGLQTLINKIGTTALTTSAITLSDAINELKVSLSDLTKLFKAQRQASNQSITTDLETIVGFNNTLVASDCMTLQPDGTVKVTKAGTYFINAHIGYNTNATGYRKISLYQNSDLKAVDIKSGSTYATVLNITQYITLVVNDIIKLTTMQSSGGSLDVFYDQVYTLLEIKKVG